MSYGITSIKYVTYEFTNVFFVYTLVGSFLCLRIPTLLRKVLLGMLSILKKYTLIS